MKHITMFAVVKTKYLVFFQIALLTNIHDLAIINLNEIFVLVKADTAHRMENEIVTMNMKLKNGRT